MNEYTNIMKADPPEGVLLSVIFNDGVRRCMVWSLKHHGLEPIEWHTGPAWRMPLKDKDGKELMSYRYSEALAWCVITDGRGNPFKVKLYGSEE